MSDPPRRSSLVFVKLGGSLITDKTRPETIRQEVLERLANELAAGIEQRRGGVVIGHGSGSFGHVAAQQQGFRGRSGETLSPVALSAVQDAAARLHRRVMAAFLEAGVPAFSIVPGSFLLAKEGHIGMTNSEVLERALEVGSVPVLYGDLVLDQLRPASILSTEILFSSVIAGLLRAGWAVERVVWFGETEGILDADGLRVPEIDRRVAADLGRTVGGSAGTDVTGGMRHRLDTVLDLARLGVRSVIADGRVPGLVRAAVTGEQVPGSAVVPDAGDG